MTKKFNVLEHELVPDHILLTEEETQEVLKKYGITRGQLPKIKASDVVVKQIGAKPGDVIKIIRKSLTAGRAVAYRLVIE
ncbi:DNA-directed RNA polymerase, subunit H [Methanocella conradii HZ254]|uniref:DNA-directed RNA polymerase subunit Rpo5 n=1 Tax=Methanocella conradii (strain DSM 24694 / JCM 17849 / CGMCC 1.5162 / HZ254) TaxID=1041930 RepID=H8I863_METCZ|nr:DNA-directed RNA polymerase subunit H [Methanocella conradii]AFD00881.1 DNA-directed RNA polymerase, subunit H [Methanocella conradii HZ254]MDI6897562.1 DNA-directed RNA polymerase subunit H [Methanocella conradii]